MLAFLTFHSISSDLNASCYIQNGKILIVENIPTEPDGVAWSYWYDSLNTTGWYKFHVHGNSAYSGAEIARCAGALEGYSSQDRIFQHFKLVRDIQGWNGTRAYPKEIEKFLSDNLKYVRESVAAYGETKFWRQIGIIMAQFDGFVEGYAIANRESNDTYMSEMDHYFLQSEGDLLDITEMYPNAAPNRATFYGQHCTGLVRLLPDYSDIYFSHDSWSDYRELHGELKEYDLNIPDFQAKTITMSTRIGKLSSFDDFYISSTGLFVLETTIGNFNEDLYQYIVPKSLFTWIRAVHATWTASSGAEWVGNFSLHNSGTYNNQYLVVDSKQLKRGEKPTSGLLYNLEQLPSKIESKDITDKLVSEGYYPSFNTPYFQDIFELAHFPQKVASWGDDGNYWDYYTSSRYYMMKREVPRINDFDTFTQFMRYNNWERDPFSNGDAGQGMLSRYDLRSGKRNHFKKALFGGLDTKALKLTEATTKMFFHALASPEYVHNPVFRFDNEPFSGVAHDGLPVEWKFNWTTFGSDSFEKCNDTKNEVECESRELCGWCTYKRECMAGDKNGPFFGAKCPAGWTVKVVLQPWAKGVVISTSTIVVIFVGIIYIASYMSKKKKE